MAVAAILVALALVLPGVSIVHATPAPARHTRGVQDVLILPVDFGDVRNSVSIQHLESLAYLSNGYIETASYNQTWLNVTVAHSWVQLNGTFDNYLYSSNLQGCPSLVRDALAYFQKQFVLSSFDQVVIVHARSNFYGMRPQEIPGQTCSEGSVVVNSVVVISESDNYLSLTHELLHSIGGNFVGPTGSQTPWVQDLYSEQAVQAHAYSPVYVDSWDLMSDEQNGLTAWTKIKLGWIQPSQVVTLNSWSDTVVNLSALEIPGGIKMVQVPVSYSKVTFQNGSTINAWSYYMIEFRQSVGIDKNLTSSVLITLGNNTKFYYRLPGPLTEVSHLSVGGTVWTTFDSLNLTIILFRSDAGSALVGFLNPSQLHSFLNASGEVNQALQAVQLHAQVVQSWPYVQPSLGSMRDFADGSLKALIASNLTEAYQQAQHALSSLQQWQAGSSQMLWGIALVADAAAVLPFVILGVYRRVKNEGSAREYVFSNLTLLGTLFILGIAIAWAAYSETGSLAAIDHGLSSGSSSDFIQGMNSLWQGPVAVLFGCVAGGFLVRQSWNVYQEDFVDVVDEEDQVVGRKTAYTCLKKGLLHRAIVVFLFDSQNRLYVQKRAEYRTFYPGRWSPSLTGHVSAGEGYSETAKKELKEELCLDCDLVEVAKFRAPEQRAGRLVERELVTIFEGKVDNPEISPRDKETEGRWISLEEFENMLRGQPEAYTPDSLLAFEQYKKAHPS
jgi:isopentenyl-diphosphate delta-isomerase type 1